MKTSWTYQNIIDFEYFCHQDKDATEGDLHQRDRNIFLGRPEELNHHAPLPRRELLRLWLNARLQSEFSGPEQKSPGALLGDTLRLAKILAVVKGLLVGLVAGVSFFSYTGTIPVNVFHFLLFFVVSQLVLASFVLCAFFFRLCIPQTASPSFYSLLLRGALRRIAGYLHKSLWQRLDAGKRAGFSYALDIFRIRSSVYGSLFYWPIFSLMQLFAIFFNIGLLAATMTKIATSDLAFGWQSTLEISSAVLHRTVQMVALPWSWLFPAGGGYPSLTAIEGSRIILKDGVYHLATGNLTAWWPFLILSLIVYGLLLRLIFSIFGRLLEERSLAGLDLDTAACRTVVRRMRTPLVSAQADPEPEHRVKTIEQVDLDGGAQVQPSHLQSQVVLVPDDIFGLCPADKLTPLLRQHGFIIKSVHKFMAGYDEDEEIKNILIAECRNPEDGLFILMEGWMPPLVSFISYLKELREILPEKTMIHLGLIGRPMRTGFTPLAEQDLAIWRKKISAARDPYLQAFSLLSS